jgi:putative phosphoribosyl transferase
MRNSLSLRRRTLWTLVGYLTAPLKRSLQLRFRDRIAAGRILGRILKDEIEKIRYPEDIENNQLIVVGVPRGGVLAASAVAKILSTELGIVFSSRLLAPHNKELTIGAVTEDGGIFLNEELLACLTISTDYIEKEKASRILEIKQGKSDFRHTDMPYQIDVAGKIVVLVDDGAFSGSTIIAAIRFLKKSGARYIIVGLPIVPKQTLSMLYREADRVKYIVVAEGNNFKSVEQFYADFLPVKNSYIRKIIENQFNP